MVPPVADDAIAPPTNDAELSQNRDPLTVSTVSATTAPPVPAELSANTQSWIAHAPPHDSAPPALSATPALNVLRAAVRLAKLSTRTNPPDASTESAIESDSTTSTSSRWA